MININIDIDEEKALKKILEIARAVVKNGSERLTRSDLAEELKSEGFKNDSENVAQAVWECYEKTGDESVKNAFVDNSKTRPLVDDAKALALLSKKGEKDEKVFDFFDDNLNSSKVNLDELASVVSNSLQTVATQASKLVNVISGASSLQTIQNEAAGVFASYTKITDSYKNARDSINTLASDYTAVRNSVNDAYRKRASQLVDVFGEKIKVTMPELFNFDSIEWLDVDSMKNNIELEYTDFSSKCGELIGGASSNFKNVLGEIALVKNNKQAALVLASWNLVSHYLDVASSATLLQSKSLQLKTAVTKDVASIKSDQMRLLEIYKTINDILLPKAKIFRKASAQIFDSEYESLVSTVYSSPEAKKLKEKRDLILDEIHYLENSLSDEEKTINFYEKHIKECNTTLKNIKSDYERAKSSKPEKPNLLKNVLSLGNAKKDYDRDVSEWSEKCSAVIRTYEDLTVDVDIESKDLLDQKKIFEENKRRYEILKRERNEISQKLMENLSSSPDVKSKIAEKLEDIIKLLKIAKDISSSKLDERLIHIQRPDEYIHKSIRDMELPADIKSSLEKFKSDFMQDFTSNFKEGIRREVDSDINSAYPKDSVSDEEKNAKSEQISEEIFQKSVSLCKIFNQIEKDGEKYAGTKEHYERELHRLQEEFKASIKNLDNQADALNEIIRRINVSENRDELKSSLLELLGTEEKPLSKEDLDDFLNGTKILEI